MGKNRKLSKKSARKQGLPQPRNNGQRTPRANGQRQLRANRQYKDRLFKAIFGRNSRQSRQWRLDL